jgi:hypothetical protein
VQSCALHLQSRAELHSCGLVLSPTDPVLCRKANIYFARRTKETAELQFFSALYFIFIVKKI